MEEKPTAYVIEDDEDLCFIFSEAMRAAGLEPEVISDGQIAIDRLAVNRPYVVVLDMHLPSVSGEEILRRIRSSAHLKDVRVIIATADARLAEQLETQADFTLIKPISFTLLREITSRIIKPIKNP